MDRALHSYDDELAGHLRRLGLANTTGARESLDQRVTRFAATFGRPPRTVGMVSAFLAHPQGRAFVDTIAAIRNGLASPGREEPEIYQLAHAVGPATHSWLSQQAESPAGPVPYGDEFSPGRSDSPMARVAFHGSAASESDRESQVEHTYANQWETFLADMSEAASVGEPERQLFESRLHRFAREHRMAPETPAAIWAFSESQDLGRFLKLYVGVRAGGAGDEVRAAAGAEPELLRYLEYVRAQNLFQGLSPELEQVAVDRYLRLSGGMPLPAAAPATASPPFEELCNEALEGRFFRILAQADTEPELAAYARRNAAWQERPGASAAELKAENLDRLLHGSRDRSHLNAAVDYSFPNGRQDTRDERGYVRFEAYRQFLQSATTEHVRDLLPGAKARWLRKQPATVAAFADQDQASDRQILDLWRDMRRFYAEVRPNDPPGSLHSGEIPLAVQTAFVQQRRAGGDGPVGPQPDLWPAAPTSAVAASGALRLPTFEAVSGYDPGQSSRGAGNVPGGAFALSSGHPQGWQQPLAPPQWGTFPGAPVGPPDTRYPHPSGDQRAAMAAARPPSGYGVGPTPGPGQATGSAQVPYQQRFDPHQRGRGGQGAQPGGPR